MPRRRSIPHTFEDRIEAEKARIEGRVARLRDGPKKDELLEKIRQLETAAQINGWLSSPGGSPPRAFLEPRPRLPDSASMHKEREHHKRHR